MKGKKLFLLGAAMMLLFTGCKNKGGNTSSEEPLPPEVKVVPMITRGSSTGFPEETIRKFMYSYDITLDVARVGDESLEWFYQTGLDEDEGVYDAVFLISTLDEGEPGVDSYEDVVLAYYEEAGCTVDKSRYDTQGYFVQDENGNDLALFYTYDGEYDFIGFGPEVEIKGIPAVTLEYYTQTVLGYEETYFDIFALDGWMMGTGNDSEVGNYFYGYADDEGEPRVDSLEDELVPLFEEAGWTIDDSEYDDKGYFAISADANVKVQFYSYGGEFDIYVYANLPL